MIKVWAEINEIENRKLIEKNQWNQKLFSEKIDKINKPLARKETKKKKYRAQITSIRNEKEYIIQI